MARTTVVRQQLWTEIRIWPGQLRCAITADDEALEAAFKDDPSDSRSTWIDSWQTSKIEILEFERY